MNVTNKGFETFSPATTAWLKSGNHQTIDGRQIFYTERGTGPVVVLIHGHPMSCHDWKGECDRLESMCRLIAMDLIGYGLSDKPEAFGYSLFEQADMIEHLLEALGIKEAHVVSHDLGSTVHTELLARAMEGTLSFKMNSAMMLNGSTLQWLSTEPDAQMLFASNLTMQKAMDLLPSIPPLYKDSLKEYMKRPEVITAEDAQVMTELLTYQDGHLRWAAITNYMRQRYVHAQRWVGALAETKVALSFVWAKEDPIANITLGHELNERFPHARYVEVPGVGHFGPIEDPETVAKQILISAGLES